ncbi:uncharacterized protein EI90DRAFT_3126983 [Cantharellus anzutake]|uniref:uncharacterized protein n=1 Tax=Cantharellus anzutake TaxID=1750568 RepID=UPI0019078174|nr:uncharacterized protein EI90DRAFT_3126983 [Cantharellus anzutake]KAF8327622.1 hypothetical protein EI90DRAFT_3126983 [Cantharellus anzutake]
MFKDGMYPECTRCIEEAARKKSDGQRCRQRTGVLRHQIVYVEDSPEEDPLAEEKGVLLDRDAAASPRVFLILLALSGIQSFVRKMSSSMCRSTDFQPPCPDGIRHYNYLDLLKLRASDALVIYVNFKQPPRKLMGCIDVWLQEDVKSWSEWITWELRRRHVI